MNLNSSGKGPSLFSFLETSNSLEENGDYGKSKSDANFEARGSTEKR